MSQPWMLETPAPPADARIPDGELAHDQFPPSPGLARVLVNGEGFGAGEDTWRLKDKVGVELLGSLCARVQGSSPAHPARVEVRIVIPR